MALPKKGATAPKANTAPAAAGPMTPEKLGQGIGKLIEGLKALHAKVDALSELIDASTAALNEKIDLLGSGVEEDEITGGADDTITADDVRQMKKPDLLKLIEEYGLDIEPEDYPKVGDLRTAIISLMEDDGTGEEGGEDGGEGAGDAGGGW